VPENLYKRGKVWWGRVQLDKRDLRKSLRTANKTKARKRLDDWQDELEHARYYGSNRMLWGDAVGRYCLEVMPGAIKPSTQKRYLVSFGAVKASLDGKFIDAIGRKEIAALVSARKRDKVTNATIARDLTAVSRVLSSAIGWGVAEHNAALEYDRSLVRERRDPIDLPTPEEIAHAYGKAPSFAGLLMLAAQTGMRQGELLSLTWRQVELNRKVINVGRSKTDLPRAIPLEGPLLSKAHGTLAGTPRHATCPLVFWHGDGQPWRNFSANFRAWRRREGVRFRFHDLRHFFAVEYLRQGGYIYDLQGILGHASIKTTEVYLKYLTPEQKQRAMRVGGTHAGTEIGGFRDSPPEETGV
jgi:integrase